MSNITYNSKIPQFLLQAYLPDQTVQLFVQSFTLSKRLNDLVQCQIVAASGISLFQLRQIKSKKQNVIYTNGVKLFSATLNNHKLIPCKLITKADKPQDSVCYFKGYVLTVAPGLATSQIKTKASLSIVCVGEQYNLMISPGKDYQQIPSSQLITFQAITNAIKNVYKESATGQLLNKNRAYTIANSNIAKSDDIATILSKFDSVDRANEVIVNGKPQLSKPQPDISKYIKSDYILSDNIISLSNSIASNPFILDICDAYAKGITQNTIWNGLLQALCSDKLLQLTPPSIADTTKAVKDNSDLKFNIKPVMHKYTTNAFSITADKITSIYLSSDMRKQITIPDHLAISFNFADYTGLSYIKIPVTYGVYPAIAKQNKQNRNTRIRVLQAPQWLQYGCPPKPPNRLKTPTQTQSTQAKKQSQALEDSAGLRYAYTRLLFFRLYASNKNIQIKMPFTDITSTIDQFIGLPVSIDLSSSKDNSMDPSWSTLDKLVGVVNAVRYQFSIAQGLQDSSSSFMINVELNMISHQDSQYAKAFAQQNSDIYKKKV